MVMAEDRMRWKRVVAEHAMPQEGMLTDWLTDRPTWRLQRIMMTRKILKRLF